MNGFLGDRFVWIRYFVRVVTSYYPSARELLIQSFYAIATIWSADYIDLFVSRFSLRCVEKNNIALKNVRLHAVAIGIDDKQIFGFRFHAMQPVTLERQPLGGFDVLIEVAVPTGTFGLKLRNQRVVLCAWGVGVRRL